MLCAVNNTVRMPRLQDKLGELATALEEHRGELDGADIETTTMDDFKLLFFKSEDLALQFKKYQTMCNERLRKPVTKKDKK